MKKVGFILLLNFSGIFLAAMQGQNGWFDNHPQWATYLNSFWRGEGVEHMSVQGDTVINGYQCKILARFEDMETSEDRTVVRIARQNGDTIWVLNHPVPNLDHFYVHYNFSLSVGDSIAVPTYYGGSALKIKYIITQTGTLTIDGQSLRYQDVDLYYENTYRCDARIIEKIGMVNTGCTYNGPNPQLWRWEHFFIDEPNEVFVDGQNWFLCQFQNDLMDFEQGDNICSGVTHVLGPEAPSPGYRVVPNPFTDRFSLQSDAVEGLRLLRIYNAAGQVVLETANPQRTIATGNLLPGVYFIEVISRSGEQSFIRAAKL